MSAGSHSTRRAAGHAAMTTSSSAEQRHEHDDGMHEQYVQRQSGDLVVHQEAATMRSPDTATGISGSGSIAPDP